MYCLSSYPVMFVIRNAYLCDFRKCHIQRFCIFCIYFFNYLLGYGYSYHCFEYNSNKTFDLAIQIQIQISKISQHAKSPQFVLICFCIKKSPIFQWFRTVLLSPCSWWKQQPNRWWHLIKCKRIPGRGNLAQVQFIKLTQPKRYHNHLKVWKNTDS